MKIRQWEVWKSKPHGFQNAHWFVVISGQELCDSERSLNVNALACFTLRGAPNPLGVVLDGADGMSAPTIVPCTYFHGLPKASLHDGLGQISWERQQQIKSKIKELFRF
jgi:hypothetical protein